MVSPAKCIAGRSAADWIAAYPVVSDLCALKETAWVNPDKLPFAQAAAACPLTLWPTSRTPPRGWSGFAPYLAAVFPETAAAGGIIESPVPPHPPDAEGAGRSAAAPPSPGRYGSSWTATCPFPLHQGPGRHLRGAENRRGHCPAQRNAAPDRQLRRSGRGALSASCSRSTPLRWAPPAIWGFPSAS